MAASEPVEFDYRVRQGRVLRKQINFQVDGEYADLEKYQIDAWIGKTPLRRVVDFSYADGSIVNVPDAPGSFQLVLLPGQTSDIPVGEYQHGVDVVRLADEVRFQLLTGSVQVLEAEE